MLATIISADHLLIYGKRSELINTRIVHFNQLLSVQGHISLPCVQRPAKWFCDGNVSGLPASGISHKLKRCAALR